MKIIRGSISLTSVIFIILAIELVTGCAPQIRTLKFKTDVRKVEGISKKLPLKAALYVSDKTKAYSHIKSAWKYDFGEHITQASFTALSQVFEEVSVVSEKNGLDRFDVVIEPEFVKEKTLVVISFTKGRTRVGIDYRVSDHDGVFWENLFVGDATTDETIKDMQLKTGRALSKAVEQAAHQMWFDFNNKTIIDKIHAKRIVPSKPMMGKNVALSETPVIKSDIEELPIITTKQNNNAYTAAKQMNILVHPFENTGDKDHSWISAGMTDTVISDLARIQNINVISNQDRKKILEEMKFIFSGLVEDDKMIKLGKLIGANVIFTGSYLVLGNRIRVNARLVNVETGKMENSTKIDSTLNDIFDLQDKVVLALMAATEKITIANVKPVILTEQDKKKIEEKPKTSVIAYEWYAKGLEVQNTNPKEALTYFQKALAIDENYVAALIESGFTTGYTLNLFDDALVYLDRADRIMKSRKDNNTRGYAVLILNIGLVYSSKGDLDRALKYYIDSQQIMARLGLQDKAYATLMMNIGIIYKNKGDLDRALKYYTDSQQVMDRLSLQNTLDYSKLMNNFGVVYSSKRDLDRALKYLMADQVIEDQLGLQDTAGYAGLMMNIGIIFGQKNDLDRALKYFLKTQRIWDRQGLQNTVGYAQLLSNMGLLYKLQGQRDMAGQYYRRAYDTYVRSGYEGELKSKALENAQLLGH